MRLTKRSTSTLPVRRSRTTQNPRVACSCWLRTCSLVSAAKKEVELRFHCKGERIAFRFGHPPRSLDRRRRIPSTRGEEAAGHQRWSRRRSWTWCWCRWRWRRSPATTCGCSTPSCATPHAPSSASTPWHASAGWPP
jgi:hypothetical protein